MTRPLEVLQGADQILAAIQSRLAQAKLDRGHREAIQVMVEQHFQAVGIAAHQDVGAHMEVADALMIPRPLLEGCVDDALRHFTEHKRAIPWLQWGGVKAEYEAEAAHAILDAVKLAHLNPEFLRLNSEQQSSYQSASERTDQGPHTQREQHRSGLKWLGRH